MYSRNSYQAGSLPMGLWIVSGITLVGANSHNGCFSDYEVLGNNYNQKRKKAANLFGVAPGAVSSSMWGCTWTCECPETCEWSVFRVKDKWFSERKEGGAPINTELPFRKMLVNGVEGGWPWMTWMAGGWGGGATLQYLCVYYGEGPSKKRLQTVKGHWGVWSSFLSC